jgi:hypothetical protein
LRVAAGQQHTVVLVLEGLEQVQRLLRQELLTQLLSVQVALVVILQ